MPADTDITPLDKPPAPATGLIASAMKAPAPAPAPAPAATWSSGANSNLGQFGLTADDISTQKRMAGVMDDNSELMQMTRGGVDAAFNARGLVNSSMAVQAGREAMLSKAMDIVNPEIERMVGIAKTNVDNREAMARQAAANAGQANIAAMNNAAAMDRAKFGAEHDLKLADVNNKNSVELQKLAAANNMTLAEFNSKSATERQQMADAAALDRAKLQITAAKDQSASDFANQLKLFDMGTERSLQLSDRAAAAELQQSYRTAAQATYDSYMKDVSAIETSDMDADVKAAQIQNLNTLYSQRQKYTNTLYQASAGWNAQWNQIAVEFGQSGAKTSTTTPVATAQPGAANSGDRVTLSPVEQVSAGPRYDMQGNVIGGSASTVGEEPTDRRGFTSEEIAEMPVDERRRLGLPMTGIA